MTTERLLEQLAAADADAAVERAPARLKARIYSALVARQTETGPLLPLDRCAAAGGKLCVFEALVAALPARADVGSANPCLICHARVLAERLERAPIFWPGCPYSEFQGH